MSLHHTLAWQLPSCVSLGKSLDLAKPVFSSVNGNKQGCWEDSTRQPKSLAQCLALTRLKCHFFPFLPSQPHPARSSQAGRVT